MPYFAIFVALVFRLLPHPWNVTPLGAMFLFSGATIKNNPGGVWAQGHLYTPECGG